LNSFVFKRDSQIHTMETKGRSEKMEKEATGTPEAVWMNSFFCLKLKFLNLSSVPLVQWTASDVQQCLQTVSHGWFAHRDGSMLASWTEENFIQLDPGNGKMIDDLVMDKKQKCCVKSVKDPALEEAFRGLELDPLPPMCPVGAEARCLPGSAGRYGLLEQVHAPELSENTVWRGVRLGDQLPVALKRVAWDLWSSERELSMHLAATGVPGELCADMSHSHAHTTHAMMNTHNTHAHNTRASRRCAATGHILGSTAW
jgi:hypothetical protein